MDLVHSLMCEKGGMLTIAVMHHKMNTHYKRLTVNMRLTKERRPCLHSKKQSGGRSLSSPNDSRKL